jgi:hypothetical protein
MTITRLAVMFFGFFIYAVQSSWADGEIGYVEDFSGLASQYRVIHASKEIPLQLCLPLYNGDTIEALDDKGRVSLRLLDHPNAVVWSRADKDTKFSAVVPKTSFWSGLMDWTVASLSPFDEQKRERILTTIRGDSGGEFGVPLLQVPQTLAAGQRVLVVGWLKPSTVAEISILAKSGRKLVNRSKAMGGLWASPALNLKPGKYHVVVAAGGRTVAGDIDVVPPLEIPQLPSELTQDGIPEPLRHSAQALWLAAQEGGRFRLEALQLIANDRSTRSATVLMEALIAGKTFELPK